MQRKCLLLCFVSLLLFPPDTASGNLPLNTEDLPLTSEDLPLTSEDLPLNTEDLPLTSEDLPLTSEDLPVPPLTTASSDLPVPPLTTASSDLLVPPLTTASSDLPVPPLTTASRDLPVINTISDLRNVEFGHTFPRHGLSLLHFIAKFLVIEQNSIWAVFLPGRNDFGFHKYGNTENIFPPISDQNRETYYSVGNLIPRNPGSTSLPPYVTEAYHQTYSPDRKKDRIVIRFNLITHRIKAIYITEHVYSNDLYDSTQTYLISVNLLREIQLLLPDSKKAFLDQAGYVWPSYRYNHYCLINEMGRLVSKSDSLAAAEDPASPKQCADIKLQVRTTQNGYARITWDNIPSNLLNVGTKLQLYKDCVLTSIFINGASKEAYSTNHNLNPGLQVRLVSRDDEVIRLSPKLDEAYWNLPTKFENFILGSEASLQLYVWEGQACVRLFIRKSFTNWKQRFENSWVGFYPSDKSAADQYSTFQWANNFNFQSFNSDYNVYEYQSKIRISPGTQARFFPTKEFKYVTATVPWESENF
ncbi:uncharacterized protein [Osmerus mordax]|uniref:uncharacterized protein n=1 Tax=Osmerus mordax TaxID=8014 RepID=UPI00351003CE